ncbi:unnamed protein product [Vitrella brassicaformis CCMP3155]|uniref:2-oxo-4-hydroxy-4-carboxy-5-ureidoimidazoline decarboxylase n=1 Tax=Vitrella brassicaformis (strain CCMP3155) TaxID=1169540 RepID=A0A0G4FQZ7_VITBC|nr:unnamed protein product [Vitrella brassicaformis CCMP3155]|eukprot:CEM16646.1 unnamed protein product [Vitrella brassicaformis CCMP3155]
MAIDVDRLNMMSADEAREAFLQCCHSSRWAIRMETLRPFASLDELEAAADRIWDNLSEPDWLEAFRGHPKIGDVDQLRQKFAATAAMCENEQAGARSASEAVLRRLKEGNDQYQGQNGFIFIVCATGKSAGEMLALLEERLKNNRRVELANACAEQAKITKLRLRKVCTKASL